MKFHGIPCSNESTIKYDGYFFDYELCLPYHNNAIYIWTNTLWKYANPKSNYIIKSDNNGLQKKSNAQLIMLTFVHHQKKKTLQIDSSKWIVKIITDIPVPCIIIFYRLILSPSWLSVNIPVLLMLFSPTSYSINPHDFIRSNFVFFCSRCER